MLNNSRTFLKVTAFHQFNSLRIPCLRLWKKVITFSPLQKIILMEAYISACRLAVEWTLSKIHRRKWSPSSTSGSYKFVSFTHFRAIISLFNLGKCRIESNYSWWRSFIPIFQKCRIFVVTFRAIPELEELVAYLEGHLDILDAVSISLKAKNVI